MVFARLRQNGCNADSVVGSLAIPLGMGSGVLGKEQNVVSANGFSEPRKLLLDSRWCLGLK
jgi:hypothetical protein